MREEVLPFQKTKTLFLSFSLPWTNSTSAAGTAKLPNLQVPSIPHLILGLGTKLKVQPPSSSFVGLSFLMEGKGGVVLCHSSLIGLHENLDISEPINFQVHLPCVLSKVGYKLAPPPTHTPTYSLTKGWEPWPSFISLHTCNSPSHASLLNIHCLCSLSY
jgi:hypothetical protein